MRKNSTYSTGIVNDRLVAMRFETADHRGAFNFVTAYAPKPMLQLLGSNARWPNSTVSRGDTKFWDFPAEGRRVLQ